MRARPSLLLLSTTALMAGCHDSSSGGSGGVLLTNLGFGAASLTGRGELWAVGVSEFDEGDADRNGDGDSMDIVPVVVDLVDGSVTDLGLAKSNPPILTVGDVLIALGVSEENQGNTDLNGDGDSFDVVLHVYDSSTRATTNAGFALGLIPPAIGGGAVAFAVSEPDQGAADLNGDGNVDDAVLHVYDARTQVTTNAQRAVTSALQFHDHAFTLTTDETSAGGDLNGDGDLGDTRIFELYDLVTGGIVSVPLAILGSPLPVAPDEWCLLVDESAQQEDLNSDGDQDDGAYLLVEPHLGTFLATGLSSLTTFGALAEGGSAAVIHNEIDGDDRNGDFDFNDSYVALLQPGLAPIFITDTPTLSASPRALTSNRLGFLVSEFEAGDLNGDGGLDDNILFAMNTASGQVMATGLEAFTLQASGEHFLFTQAETEGLLERDLNGDGDFDDAVLAYRNTLTGALAYTGLAGAGPPVVATNLLLQPIGEMQQGSDLNGDGDTDDDVWFAHELLTGLSLNLGVAGIAAGGGALLDDGRGILLVSEEGEGAGGTDLNGDGDAFDVVAHTLRLP
jgi:hypothetical protein